MLAVWEDPYPPLEPIAEHYWKLDAATAKRKAKTQQLPIPAIRGMSQKSGWRVSIEDLSKWLDGQREEAAKVHQRMAATPSLNTYP